MTIESISGHRKYRVNPYNTRIIDVQHRHGARWQVYATKQTEQEAMELILLLARDVKGEEEQGKG